MVIRGSQCGIVNPFCSAIFMLITEIPVTVQTTMLSPTIVIVPLPLLESSYESDWRRLDIQKIQLHRTGTSDT